MSARPSYAEAWQIAKAIRPWFAEYMTQYDTKKYWPVVYERVRREFRQPEKMAPGTLRDALLWKYGHLGKPAIPPAHELLEPSHIAKMPETSGFILLPLSFLRVRPSHGSLPSFRFSFESFILVLTRRRPRGFEQSSVSSTTPIRRFDVLRILKT
jgi:hypothetical protein